MIELENFTSTEVLTKQRKNQQTQRQMIWNCPIKIQKENNNEKSTLKRQ